MPKTKELHNRNLPSYKKQVITFGGSEEADMSASETSDVINIPENVIWSISPNVTTAIVGSPTYTVQASSDNNTWFDYTTDLTGVAITDALDVEGFGFPFMRITTVAGTSGAVKFTLITKLLNY